MNSGALYHDTILPSQTSKIHRDPCISRLLMAVLDDAVRTVMNRPKSPAAKEAREWFRSDDRSPFSFLEICDYFGVDPNKIRNRSEWRPPGRRIYIGRRTQMSSKRLH